MLSESGYTQWRNNWLIKNNTRILVLVSSALCVTSQLKIAEIQFLEFFYAAEVLLLAVWFLLHPNPLRIFRPFYSIGLRWTIFSFFALLLAAFSLRQNFYLEHVGPLKQPFILSVARIGELFLDVFFMLYLAERYRRDGRLCRFAAITYYLVGVAGALYSLISLPLGLSGVYNGWRMRGFNNEGGSFGTYVATLVFLTMALKSEGWISRRTALFSQVLFAINLIGSQSKAALFEFFVFLFLVPALRLRGVKLIGSTIIAGLVMAFVWITFDVNAKLWTYTSAIGEYQRVSVLRPNDYNYVAGRVAGLFLAPTMIMAHPLVGIGLGNYPIVRDDPQYRKGTPIIEPAIDSPSLGPIDYIVDLGFPLFFYFTWVEIAPAISLLKRGEKAGVVCLMLMQPVANWFGAHLNLTYPWVGAAIALGISYGRSLRQDPVAQLVEEVPLPVNARLKAAT